MFNILMSLIIAMVCSCIISFLQLCFYRMKSGFSLVDILFKPSHCEHCQSKINAIFLIPIYGFLISEGSCQYCNESISLKYFIAEVSVFVMAFFYVLNSLYSIS
ncbi:prepilin peptidase [Shewanella sp. YLB-07]|uniref:prepilin peptidase n=1 Tax=Shewanella sp. YLB-07 TaxID=2601268 RepID=UPI00128B178D|nr:prepilin peptidase [Shewanella sp. YLB-07]